MLSGPREAHHPADERVVTTVRVLIAVRKQFVQTVRRPQPSGRHVIAQRPQAWSRHRDQQRRLALATRGKVGETGAHELVAGQIGGHLIHARHFLHTPI